MYLTFIKKELLSNILSLRYAMVLLLFLLLTTASVVVRTQIFEKQLSDYQRVAPQYLLPLTKLNNQYESRELGITVEHAPNPLSIFAAGLENEMTRSFTIADRSEPKIGFRKLNNASFQYSLNLDMVLIISLVCSLLAMLLMFDSITGEKENGTLKVLLSGPLPRDVIIIGKMVAGLVTVAIPLVLSWLVALVYVLVLRKIGLAPEDFARLAWLVGLSFLVIAFFFSFGIAVSCWTQRSATSLAVCLFFWIFIVLAAPNLIPMAVKHIAPIPPQSKIIQERQTIDEDVFKTCWPVWRQELVAEGKVKTADDAEAMWRILDSRSRVELAKRFEKLDRYYKTLVLNQVRLNQAISRVSPAASFTFAATQIAGTGAFDFIRLCDDIDVFQRSYLENQEEQELKRIARKVEFEPYDPALFPRFVPSKSTLAAALNRCWTDIGILVTGTFVLFILGFIGFMRYDPR